MSDLLRMQDGGHAVSWTACSRPTPRATACKSTVTWQATELSNGATALMCHKAGSRLTCITVILAPGSAADDPARRGEHAVLARTIGAGSGHRDLPATLERLGAKLTIVTAEDSSQFRVTLPAEHAVTAAKLLSQAIFDPGIEDQNLRAVQTRQARAVAEEAANPASRAEHALRAALYQDGYGYPPSGTHRGLAAISCDSVRELHQRLVQSARVGIVAAGDLEDRGLLAALDDQFGSRACVRSLTVGGPAIEVRRPPPLRLIADVANMAQAIVFLGRTMKLADDDEAAAAAVALHHTAGWFGSRLNTTLREKGGFTYGVASNLSVRRDPRGLRGELQIRLAVSAAEIRPAMTKLFGELADLSKSGITESDWRLARGHLGCSDLAATERASDLVSACSDLVQRGHAAAAINMRSAKIAVVPHALGQATLRRFCDPSRLSIAVVGARDLVVRELSEVVGRTFDDESSVVPDSASPPA